MERNHFEGRTMHIDTSRRFKQIGDSSVAFKIVNSKIHRGLVLSNKLKRELDRDFGIDKNYPLLYAICIHRLIHDRLDMFDTLVACNDEDYSKMKKYLDYFFKGNKEYPNKKIMCIGDLRKISGYSKIRSYADGIANIYRRKALKPIHRRQRGIELDICEINYSIIKDIIGKIKM